MGLRVYSGKNNFSKPDEGDFFFYFAHALKYMFKENDYDGILLGVPFTKGQSDRYLQLDAVLFAKNAIVVVDFKSHGGVITTPTKDDEYETGVWYTDQPGPDKYIKGGCNRPNPFVQVQDYQAMLRKDVLFDIPGAKNRYINTGVIFYGNDADVSKTYIPDKYKSKFFIANNDINTAYSYFYKIKSILGSKKRENKTVQLSDSDLTKIREKFIVHEELADDFIKEMIGISADELAKYDSEMKEMQLKLFMKETELIEKRKTIEKKDLELAEKDDVIASKDRAIANKDRTNELLAGKNLTLIKEGRKKDSENAKLKTEKLKSEEKCERLQREIEALRNQKDLSPEVSKKLDQVYDGVEALKNHDFGKEINSKWEKEFTDLKKELSEIKENASTNSVYLFSNSRPKWLTLLISCLSLAVISVLIGVIINVIVLKSSESVIKVSRPSDLEGPYHVNYVRDGDTIYVDFNGENTGVRLIGIEAPESEDSNKEGSRCFNRQAKSYLYDKIGDNDVYLEYDGSQGEVDYYGRLMRYVWIDDELLNLSLIADGYAKEFTFNNEYKYKNEFNQAQAKARQDGLGLWTTCAE